MNNLSEIRKKMEKSLFYKNIAPLRKLILELPNLEDITVSLEDMISINSTKATKENKDFIDFVAKKLMPWRKGPFKILNTFIDSEWKSQIKYNLLKPYFDIKDKKVADIGCNNGYYMFRMLKEKPKKIVGFDPSALFKTQFDFINHFIKSDICYELLGVEHLSLYEEKFDTIFCLGVLYHRSDPISTLKSLKQGLNKNGELFLDTFIIDGEEDYALTPKDRYSKIPNIYFIPTINALSNWLYRAGFKNIELLEIKKTDLNEQRKTSWIQSQSLENFLNPSNPNITVEGYPAPKRAYIKAFMV